jgi:hypothetical protein
MCTVTFMPRQMGYCLAMNRDEKLARPQGLAPALRIVENRRVICPSEPGGGTWMALNDFGVSLALINCYSIPARIEISPVTRGEVVKAALTAEEPKLAEALLLTLPLNRINPFRLIGIFPVTCGIVEWRWDLKTLEREVHTWQPRQWVSSGFDESAAQRERGRTFQEALKEKSVGSLNWLRRLHRSHTPEKGPFSTCMHRLDAATVSYAETVVSVASASMWYSLGPPCQHQLQFVLSLKREQHAKRRPISNRTCHR